MDEKKTSDESVVHVPPELMEALERVMEDNAMTLDAVVRGILKNWLRIAGYLPWGEEQ